MNPLMLPVYEVTPEEARSAALVLAGIAAAKDSPCGLSEVLNALALKETLLTEETS